MAIQEPLPPQFRAVVRLASGTKQQNGSRQIRTPADAERAMG